MSAQFLSRWGVIGVEGDDAVAFLQAQLSNDVAGMAESQLRMAGLCTAKGRLLGSFFVLRHGKQVFLMCRKETIPALVKRLSMFVLRSKCKVRDCTAEYKLAYLPDSALVAPMRVQWEDSADVKNATASLRQLNGTTPGFQLVAATGALEQAEADDAFEFALQQLGIAYVSQATVEMFIPQAINFDLVGGVSFSKGCYPGQEIVARSHYLGKVKRRVFQATANSDVLVLAGQDVWLAGKENEPAGQVATAVSHNGVQHLLVELAVGDTEQAGATFTVKNDLGEVSLQVNAPPYDVHQKGNVFEVA
ncbi:CAF17-like 4Fe-4S cluster assembly/insertion protein YgfZ [Limnobacter parvus]|uniref:Folate-binding protein n=1 Tax=Limnobacter parvus TaxID=2939690 RepID=A0ABT1XI31_9BURK|nr:folate-binding protein [Limnobacter parvus]MCR2746932.1 folate-binding protein [Limnobacter parvus]